MLTSVHRIHISAKMTSQRGIFVKSEDGRRPSLEELLKKISMMLFTSHTSNASPIYALDEITKAAVNQHGLYSTRRSVG